MAVSNMRATLLYPIEVVWGYSDESKGFFMEK